MLLYRTKNLNYFFSDNFTVNLKIWTCYEPWSIKTLKIRRIMSPGETQYLKLRVILSPELPFIKKTDKCYMQNLKEKSFAYENGKNSNSHTISFLLKKV